MKKTRRENSHIRKKRIGWGVVLSVFLLILAGLASRFVIARYYAYKAEKGISVASAFYFNSDKLVKPAGGVYATQAAVQSLNPDNFSVTVNQDKWTGGDCLFTVEIRNYDNNLLYNETNLNLDYVIYFRLVGTPKGATYKVQGGQWTTDQELKTNGACVSTTGHLDGGSPQSEVYRIHINTIGTGSQYDNLTAAKVLVAAYPTSPDYIKTDAEHLQEHFLCGVFQGVLTAANMTIESSHFKVQSTNAYKTNWKNAVIDQSGLIYTVRTGGDALIDEQNSIKQEACIKWRSDYLQVSKYEIENRVKEAGQKAYDKEYDTVYQTQIAGGVAEEDARAAADTAAAVKKTEAETATETKWTTPVNDASGHPWITVTIETLPNTEINVTFYKTDTFFSQQSSAMTKALFESLATAYIPVGS